ncbi:MAG: MBOAT family O-acyltransferase [Oscillospiraceae bacterium]
MGFTTQVFTFIFFPLCFGCYFLESLLEEKTVLRGFLEKYRVRDLILIAFSFGFYMWACFDDIYKLLIYIGLVYLAARWIQWLKRGGSYLKVFRENDASFSRKLPFAQIALVIAVTGVVACLVYFKYSTFLAQLGNALLNLNVQPKSILSPLGISFITFSAISYLADVYRGTGEAGSLIDCALYMSFFPKVVSGPIVLWRDYQPQIRKRKTNLNLSVTGLNRIMIGFAKNVLLADQFGACLASFAPSGVDVITAWGGCLLYMLQLYYDFSGYSDIAIGLANLLGFEFKMNFNFPYRSKSIGEFWRRWHISLGTWFRQYVYIPLGGSRVSLKRNLFNLAVVFVLTGIWHGAGWNYILWGCINGAFVLLERVCRDKPRYQKTPGWIKWASTMTITFFCWELLRFSDLSEAVHWVGIMFGAVRFDKIGYTWRYYFSNQIVFLTIVGILGSTLLGSERIQGWYRKFSSTAAGYLIQELVLLMLFALAILFMVNSTYSPFIYFQY